MLGSDWGMEYVETINVPTGVRVRQVLVIDDDLLVCEVIRETLQEWPGTNVTCAHDGIEGAEKLHESHYDLALNDGSLPVCRASSWHRSRRTETPPYSFYPAIPTLIRRQRGSDFHICPSRFRSASYC